MLYLFTGDIIKAGSVTVEADTLDQAIDKLADQDFTIYDEQDRPLVFRWNDDTPEEMESTT